jgi:hypothetical protein
MTKKDKVKHVLKAKQTRDHDCHWPGCGRQVPPALWGCKEHWFLLPIALRNKLWMVYVPGQEEKGNPTKEYVKVAREIQAWIENYKEGETNA